MKSRMLFLSLVIFLSLTPMLGINYNTAETEPKADSIRSCTPLFNWSSTSSDGNKGTFEATAISGNQHDVDKGANVFAKAHAGSLDDQETSHNSLTRD